MKKLSLALWTLLVTCLGTLLWAFWATRGACDGIEWFLEALIMVAALRVPLWVWPIPALAFFAVRFAVLRRKGRTP